MDTGVGISHAKIILFGEHAVVYGQPAIALPVNSIALKAVLTPRNDGSQWIHSTFYSGSLSQTHNTRFAGIATLIRQLLHFFETNRGFDLTITSQLPPERGMGSSAATAVAVIRAFYAAFSRPLTQSILLNWASISEKILHGDPSGIDAATTSATRPQWFVRGQSFHEIALPTHGVLVIADSGVPGQTKQAVAKVAAQLKQDPTRYQPLITDIGKITRAAAIALVQNDSRTVGKLMTADHRRLQALGVSTPGLDTLVTVACESGAFGAKMTGSGLGGCVIALTDQAHADAVSVALDHAGASEIWQERFSTK